MKYTEDEIEFVETCAIMCLTGVINKSGIYDNHAVLSEQAFKMGKAMLVERRKLVEENINVEQG